MSRMEDVEWSLLGRQINGIAVIGALLPYDVSGPIAYFGLYICDALGLRFRSGLLM